MRGINVICFGDSNLYGYAPHGYFGGHYGAGNRWVHILDVREQDKYSSGHIPGAVLLPVGAIDESTAAEVIPEKDSTILIHCRSGNRSKTLLPHWSN